MQKQELVHEIALRIRELKDERKRQKESPRPNSFEKYSRVDGGITELKRLLRMIED